MGRKRNYNTERADNPPYVPQQSGRYYDNMAYHGASMQWPATKFHGKPDQFVPPDMGGRSYTQRNHGDAFSDSSDISSKSSSKRRCIIISIAVICLLTLAAVVAAIAAAALSSEKPTDVPEYVEKVIIKTFQGEVRMSEANFTEEYNDKNSTTYKTAETEFVSKMDAKFAESDMADSYVGTEVVRFKPGSIIAEVNIKFQKTVTVEKQTPSADATTTTTAANTVSEDLDFGFSPSDLSDVIESGGEFTANVTETNECDSNPCDNGASCIDGVNVFTCECAPGWEGATCAINIDDCEDGPCLNGGSCTDGIDGFSCDCLTGTAGTTCETNLDDCAPNPCKNGGSCEDKINAFACVCADGYNGDTCENDIDDCNPNPCEHGFCTDAVNNYTCACVEGYTGVNCDINIDDCTPNPCQNGGQCTDGVNNHACACVLGFDGNNCENNIDDCSPNPCQNGGVCTDGVNTHTCACADGYTDDNCEKNIDDCSPNPCQNGGVCTDGVNTHTCACADGYTDDNCEKNIDDCSPNPCQNGGVCTDGVNTHTCACADGYTDDNCEKNIDDCSPNPCQNGGVCTDGVNTHTCACADGYTDDNCEKNIDDCSPNPCQNGGVCTDGVNTHTCACVDGYTDDNCEKNIDDCSPNPCQNGGVCTDGVNTHTCACADGYTDDNCETNIDDCSPNPCQNGGVCTDGVNTHTCACADGYTDDNCEKNIDDCSPNPCQNGGVCTDGVNTHTCACADGYTDDNCEKNIDDCSPNPCQNGGVCTDGVNTHTCACVDGYTDDNCEKNIDDCSPNPCQNGGVCTDGVNTHTCACADGYTDDNCETNINDCEPDLCENNSTCHDGVDTFTCECMAGYTGPLCQTNVNDCVQNPCANGATCHDGVDTYKCECAIGFSGPNCQKNIDDCSPNPCQNGGVCTDGVNTHTCACVDGYTDDNCETNIDDCSPNPCKNGGVCTDGVNTHTCACADGYTDENCETNINECDPNPCVHGRCLDDVNNFTCICDQGYFGRLCSQAFDYCDPNPCYNGTCTSGSNGATCTCIPGYTGEFCETDIDECGDRPCQNFGSCVNNEGGYFCMCNDQYYGEHCEYEYNVTTSTPTYPTTYTPGPCPYAFNVSGVMIIPFSDALRDMNSPAAREMQGMVYDNATDILKVNNTLYSAMCDMYVNGFRPINITEMIKLNIAAASDDVMTGFGMMMAFNMPSLTSNDLKHQLQLRAPPGMAFYNVSRVGNNTTPPTPSPTTPYPTVCEHYFSDATGNFSSPNYPNPYNSNSNCTWYIMVDSQHQVELTFYNMELEDNYDYVVIYDQWGTSGEYMARLTGLHDVYTVISTGYVMTVHFISDSNAEWNGFFAKYRSIEGKYNVTTSTPTYPTTYTPGPCPYAFNVSGVMMYPFSDALWDMNSPDAREMQGMVYDNATDILKVNNTLYSAMCDMYVNGFRPINITEMVKLKIAAASDDVMTGFGMMMAFNMPSLTSNDLMHQLQLRAPPGMAFYNVSQVGNNTTPPTPSPTPPSDCVHYLYGENGGNISSPGPPGMYDNDAVCFWYIYVNTGYIEVNFNHIGLEYDVDYLYIFNGMTIEEEYIASFTGRHSNVTVRSNGTYMTVHFKSDSVTTSDYGFDATYRNVGNTQNGTTTPYPHHCSEFNVTGVVTSEFFYDSLWDMHSPEARQTMNLIYDETTEALQQNYTVYSNMCDMYVVGFVPVPQYGLVFPGFSLMLSFNLPGLEPWHLMDMLGSYPMTDLYIHNVTRVGNNTTPPTPSPTTPYPAVCEHYFFDATGNFSSPNYPNPYNSNSNCTWYIMVDSQHQVELTFYNMELEDNYDYVDIYDRWGTSGEYMARLTGSRDVYTVISTGYVMTVHFISDSNAEWNGFFAKYRSIEGKYNVTTSTPTYPTTYTPGPCPYAFNVSGVMMYPFSDALWDMNSPDAREMQGMVYDNATDILKVNNTLYSAMCDMYVNGFRPINITEMVKLKIAAASDDVMTGFGMMMAFNMPSLTSNDLMHQLQLRAPPGMAFYNVSQVGNNTTPPTPSPTPPSDCVHYLYGENGGNISSPGPPGMYDNDAVCFWYIYVNTGYIEVNFNHIGLEYDVDYLYIFNGMTIEEEYIASFTGRHSNVTVRSNGTYMTVHFKSDSVTTSDYGFDATYRNVGNTQNGTTTPYPHHCSEFNVTGVVTSEFFYDSLWDMHSPEARQTMNLIYDETTEALQQNYTVYSNMCDMYVVGFVPVPQYGLVFPGFSLMLSFNLPGLEPWHLMDMLGSYPMTDLYIHNVTRVGNNTTPPTPSPTTPYPAVCEHYFFDATGNFSSPNYPNPYNSNSNCTWYIMVDSQHQVELTFYNMELEDNYDYVDIYDRWGTSGEYMARLTGSRDVYTVISTGYVMTVHFISDSNAEWNGFFAKYRSIEGKYNVTTSTPTYPTTYTPGPCPYAFNVSGVMMYPFSDALWDMNSPDAREMQGMVYDNATDILKVNNTLYSAMCDMYVNGFRPINITEMVKLKIAAASDDVMTGFGMMMAFNMPSLTSNDLMHQLQLRAPPGMAFYNVSRVGNNTTPPTPSPTPPSDCVHYLYGENGGNISSPGPPGMYDNDAVCFWYIYVNTGYIEVNFNHIGLEYDVDYLYIFNGMTIEEEYIASFTGRHSNVTVRSNGTYMTVHFKSDSVTTSDYGFDATYRNVGNTQNGTTTPYPHHCSEFNVTGVVTSEFFYDSLWDMHSPEARQTMNLIYDETTEALQQNYTVYSNMCDMYVVGFVPVPQYGLVFPGFSLMLSFNLPGLEPWHLMDMLGSYPMTDLYIHNVTRVGNNTTPPTPSPTTPYPAVCEHYFFDATGNFSSPNYPNPYNSNSNCTWYIMVDSQHQVELTFYNMELEDNYDYVDIYDRWGTSGEYMARLTGSRDVYTVISTGYVMTVHFISDSNAEWNGFFAKYRSIEGSTTTTPYTPSSSTPGASCGGYISGNGNFVSPGYTNYYYPTGINCTWYISVDMRSKVQLYIHSIEAEAFADWVAVYDGLDTDDENLIVSLTGVYYNRTFVSSSSDIVVVFSSDSYQSYQRGFNASVTAISQECGQYEFRCDGTCHPMHELCDERTDCRDGIDELGCRCYEYGYLSCGDNSDTCYSKYEACDGHSYCGIADEGANCDCPYGRCHDGLGCLDPTQICDGYVDCSDISDEKNCSYVCLPDQFECHYDGNCINETLHCDGKKDCDDGTDEWYLCPIKPTTAPPLIEYEIQLVGHNGIVNTDNAFGRVEVRRLNYNEPWGTICDDSFDSRDANVICFHLGFPKSANNFAYGNAAFGRGSGPVYLSNLHCTGTETSLSECVTAPWSTAHCSHQQDASVSCGIDQFTTGAPNYTTTTPWPYTTTQWPIDAKTRLVDGSNCLEGRLEVFYNDIWGTVCDDGFGQTQADIVCKSLGFSHAISFLSNLFRDGEGQIWMDNVYCYGNERSITECSHGGWGDHNCAHSEDVDIQCAGIAELDCIVDPGIPNVNCTFDQDRCSYNATAVTGDAVWHRLESGTGQNYTMVYDNGAGVETDSSRLLSPPFTVLETDNNHVDFHYLLRNSAYRDLVVVLQTLGVDGEVLTQTEIWASKYLSRGQDNALLYACANLNPTAPSVNYRLAFDATRGPDNYPVPMIVLDDVMVSTGHCPTSLVDEPCLFDTPETCGMVVNCAICSREELHFDWMWTNNTRITSEGSFMMADSSFGQEGDEALMTFTVPRFMNYRAIEFDYFKSSYNDSHLQVVLGDSILLEVSELTGRSNWVSTCARLPDDLDFNVEAEIKFKVIRGSSFVGEIGIDTVHLRNDCPHVITCQEGEKNCGWEIDQYNPMWTWQFSAGGGTTDEMRRIRLVGSAYEYQGNVEVYYNGEWGAVCDQSWSSYDASAACRMLGYEGYYDYYFNSNFGYYDMKFWLTELGCGYSDDDLFECYHSGVGNVDAYYCDRYNMAGLYCTGDRDDTTPVLADFTENFFYLNTLGNNIYNATWASLSSVAFPHPGGDYSFGFYYQMQNDFELTVWAKDEDANITNVLSKIIEGTSLTHFYCVELPVDMIGLYTVGVTAYTNQTKAVYEPSAFIRDFQIWLGSCTVDIYSTNACTFEADERQCKYEVTTTSTKCDSSYQWKLTNMNDSSVPFMNRTGSFMHVSLGLGVESDFTWLVFHTIPRSAIGSNCAVGFDYFTSNYTTNGIFGVDFNSQTFVQELTPLHMMSGIWRHGCLDFCSQGIDGDIDVSFYASNAIAGVDNVKLQQSCPSIVESVDCEFVDGDTCGYIFNSDIWTWYNNTFISTRFYAYNKEGGYLISPEFHVDTQVCLTVGMSSLQSYGYINMKVINRDGETTATTGNGNEYIGYSAGKNFSLTVQGSGYNRLYIDAFTYYTQGSVAINFVQLTMDECQTPAISCNEGEVFCDHMCIDKYNMCDGHRDCSLGEDEVDCPCDMYNAYNCSDGSGCTHRGFLCDGIQDCADNSDEGPGCSPSVDCNFEDGNCGYTLHSVEIVRADSVYPNAQQYGYVAVVPATMGYLLSPPVDVYTPSCLVFGTISVARDVFIRVATMEDDSYTTRSYYQIGYNTNQVVILTIDIPSGIYSGILIETQTLALEPYNYGVGFDEITLLPVQCSETGLNTTATTPTTTAWHDHTYPTTRRPSDSTGRTTNNPWMTTTRGSNTETRWPTTHESHTETRWPTTRGSNTETRWPTTYWPPYSTTERPSSVRSVETPRYQTATSWPHTTSDGYRSSTTAPIPDNFPDVSIIPPSTTALGGYIDIVCTVNNPAAYKVILYWATVDYRQIARDDDIMIDIPDGEDSLDKYSASIVISGTITTYTLTINQIDYMDSGVRCMVDVIGFPYNTWPQDSVTIEIASDGCEALDSDVCGKLGYGRVIPPTASGLIRVWDMNNRLNDLENMYKNRFPQNLDPCLDALMELACGLHATPCVDGTPAPSVCREDCQAIQQICPDAVFNIVLSNNEDLSHYCKFLPYMSEEATCKHVWMSCDSEIQLSRDYPIHLTSPNYPSASPDESPCTYSLYGDKYHVIQLDLIDVLLDADCEHNYILITSAIGEDKYCSNNASGMATYPVDSLVVHLVTMTTGGYNISAIIANPAGVCDLVGYTNHYVSSSIYESAKTDNCNQWIFYNDTNYYDRYLEHLLIFMEPVTSCVHVSIFSQDDTLLQVICAENYTTEIIYREYVLLLSDDDFVLNITTRYNYIGGNSFTIDEISLVDGYSENEGLVYIRRSDGVEGYVCSYSMYYDEATVICKQAGFGGVMDYSRDYNTERYSILGYMNCNGDEDDIMDCYGHEWHEEPQSHCSHGHFRVECTQSSVNWNISTNTGYKYDRDYFTQAWYAPKGATLVMYGTAGQMGTVTSPGFSYTPGAKINFGYSIFSPLHSTSLQLSTGSEMIALWSRPDITLEGYYEACVVLPDAHAGSATPLQLVFTIGNHGWASSNSTGADYPGLTGVSLHYNDCPGTFPDTPCDFNNIEACGPPSGLCMTPSDGNTLRNPAVWQVYGNQLMADSKYAESGTEYPVTLPGSDDTSQTQYLFFSYSTTGIGVDSYNIELSAYYKGVHAFTSSEYTPNIDHVCMKLPEDGSGTGLTFVFTTGSALSWGSVHLYDVSLTTKECPHPKSCDFETDYCGYNVPNYHYTMYWNRGYGGPIDTPGGPGGYLISLTMEYITEGNSANFSTGSVYLNDDHGDYQCLSFYYKIPTTYYDTALSFDVNLAVRVEFNKNVSLWHDVDLVEGGWVQYNMPIVNDEEYPDANFSFIVTTTTDESGTEKYSQLLIYIDNIEFLRTPCIMGLQDIDVCTFDSPHLCNYHRNCTVGSGYIWTRHSYNTSTPDTGPMTDGDGDSQGMYLYVDSSLGEEGQTSLLWFVVTMPTDVTGSQYTFMYHMMGDGVGSLETFYRDENIGFGAVSMVPAYDNDVWETACFDLPDNFNGEIYLRATRGATVFGDIAIDNVKISQGGCPVSSVPCDFETDNCGYFSEGAKWTVSDGYIESQGPSTLYAPLHTLVFTDSETEACVAFEAMSDSAETPNYTVFTHDMYDDEERVGFKIYEAGLIHYGQVQISSYTDRLAFETSFRLKILNIVVTYGACPTLYCVGLAACVEKCIPTEAVCDRQWDCTDGSDESQCGFSVDCPFTNEDSCGYEVAKDEPSDRMSIVQDYSYNNADGQIVTITPSDSGMMLIKLTGTSQTLTHVMSVAKAVPDTSCLKFEYVGNLQYLVVTATSVDDTLTNVTSHDWHDSSVPHGFSTWRNGQVNVEAGMVYVSITTSMAQYSGNPSVVPAFVAIDSFTLQSGTCVNHPIVCDGNVPNACEDQSLCYPDDEQCNDSWYCRDGTDEGRVLCGIDHILECDFESDDVCGYNVTSPYEIRQTPDGYWRRRSGYYHQTPKYDHTYRNLSGHFLQFSDWSNDNRDLSYAYLASPVDMFEVDGCITLWYWLNASAVQPNAFSAQIAVGLIYDYGPVQTGWYDYADRTISDWQMAAIPVVKGRSVQLQITAISFETLRVYPGSIAIDDVEFTPGDCPVQQICNENSFMCETSGLCIPQAYVCDGNNDCADQSDEGNCNTRPWGEMQLIGGDGSYGALRYFTDDIWHDVCYPYYDYNQETFRMNAARFICQHLGYGGNVDIFPVGISVRGAAVAVELDCVNSTDSCTTYINYCDTYTGIKCSHHTCFSGERMCPGTGDTCTAAARFCDGLPDCDGNLDETTCLCDVDNNEDKCIRQADECFDRNCQSCEEQGRFECLNHKCIDLSLRCDGVNDCGDGTDEYKCVFVEQAQVKVVHQGVMTPVCIDGIDRTVAEKLCSLSGKGMLSAEGIHHGYEMISGALRLEYSSSGNLFPGISVVGSNVNCYGLILQCQLPECGSPAYMDNFVNPAIINGRRSLLGEWPWMGALLNNGNTHCGSTYIGDQWVLTAQHCIDDFHYVSSGTYMVRFASLNAEDPNGMYAQDRYIQSVHLLDGYNSNDVGDGYDLALIELTHPPNIDNFTRPICLGNEESLQYVRDQFIPGEKDMSECFIAGYGLQEQYVITGSNDGSILWLSESRISIVPEALCDEIFQELANLPLSHDGLCLEHVEPYSPACFGDSGGPMMCKTEQGIWKQFGVTSYTLRGCAYANPMVYINIPRYQDWIEEITGIPLS